MVIIMVTYSQNWLIGWKFNHDTDVRILSFVPSNPLRLQNITTVFVSNHELKHGDYIWATYETTSYLLVFVRADEELKLRESVKRRAVMIGHILHHDGLLNTIVKGRWMRKTIEKEQDWNIWIKPARVNCMTMLRWKERLSTDENG